MNSVCMICKSCGVDLPAISKERIYKKYRTFEVGLCYKHSVELFKIGQEQFILKHFAVAKEHDWVNEGEMKKSVSYF